MISVDKLIKATGCSAQIAVHYSSALNIVFERYELESAEQKAMFLAQVGHESGSLSRVVENLNYSADRLLAVFPKYFKDAETAAKYARKPELIANRVYASRMGNGPEESGDGWKFRGRGLIQITGKFNYKRMSEGIDHDCVAKPQLLEHPLYAAISAGEYWKWHGLKDIADIKAVTRKINGGFNGLEDRIKRYQKALQVLQS